MLGCAAVLSINLINNRFSQKLLNCYHSDALVSVQGPRHEKRINTWTATVNLQAMRLLTAIKRDENRPLGQYLYDCFPVSSLYPLVTFVDVLSGTMSGKIIDDIHKERSNSAFVCLTQLKPIRRNRVLCNRWTLYM